MAISALILLLFSLLALYIRQQINAKYFTEKKIEKQTAELKESKDRFDELAEQSGSFTWEVDPEGLYTYVSHIAEKVIGYKPEELVGKKHFYDLHPEHNRERFIHDVFKLFENEKKHI